MCVCVCLSCAALLLVGWQGRGGGTRKYLSVLSGGKGGGWGLVWAVGSLHLASTARLNVMAPVTALSMRNVIVIVTIGVLQFFIDAN